MESSREIQQRIQDFSRQLAEEFGDISWDQFGSPFEAIEVRGAEIGPSAFCVGDIQVLGLVTAALKSHSNTKGREDPFSEGIHAISSV